MCSIYYIHISYFKVNVLLFSALGDSLIALVFFNLNFLLIKAFRCFSIFEKFLINIVCISFAYIIIISVPTIIDRSLSFYTLEKIDQRGGGIKKEYLEKIYATEYVREHKLAEVRLTEQEQSGTVIIENDCIKLTEKGKKLASFSRFFRLHYLPKKRLLNGSYSDQIVDPFLNSSNPDFDYSCGK